MIEYSMNLSPQTKIALLSRAVNPAFQVGSVSTAKSPMRAILSAYPGCRIVGDHPAHEDDEDLGVVFIQKRPTKT
jgi:hypothetical protein